VYFSEDGDEMPGMFMFVSIDQVSMGAVWFTYPNSHTNISVASALYMSLQQQAQQFSSPPLLCYFDTTKRQ